MIFSCDQCKCCRKDCLIEVFNSCLREQPEVIFHLKRNCIECSGNDFRSALRVVTSIPPKSRNIINHSLAQDGIIMFFYICRNESHFDEQANLSRTQMCNYTQKKESQKVLKWQRQPLRKTLETVPTMTIILSEGHYFDSLQEPVRSLVPLWCHISILDIFCGGGALFSIWEMTH